MRLEVGRGARQRRSQCAAVVARLERHDAPVREDALHAVAPPNDLSPGAFHREDALAALAVGVAVHDVQRLGRAVEHVDERAAIVQILDGAAHALEPIASFLSRGLTADERQQQQGRSRDGMSHLHCLLQAFLLVDARLGHGAVGDDRRERRANDVRVDRATPADLEAVDVPLRERRLGAHALAGGAGVELLPIGGQRGAGGAGEQRADHEQADHGMPTVRDRREHGGFLPLAFRVSRPGVRRSLPDVRGAGAHGAIPAHRRWLHGSSRPRSSSSRRFSGS